MDFSVYQKLASNTAVYPDRYRIEYPTLGLVGEAGEVANKVKKILRDNDGIVSDDAQRLIGAELGDVLWYIATLCSELDLDMSVIAHENLQKLAERQANGRLKGSGDTR